MRISVIGAAMLLVATGANAETVGYHCKYPTFSDQDGSHKVGKEGLSLTFIADMDKWKAYLIGNVGASEVMMQYNTDIGISFIEVTKSGNVMTTTIDRNMRSAHSRHYILFSDFFPSQHYGRCQGTTK